MKMASEKRLIDANEAYEIARSSGLHDDFGRCMADLTSLKELLEDCTTVDAVEVVHGRWVYEPIEFTYEKDIKCSICGSYAQHATNYCPNCGAKMDGERKDNG